MTMSMIEADVTRETKIPVDLLEKGTTDGTQAIRRAVTILRLVATKASSSTSLANICEDVRLPRSTTHRILKCLVSEGLLEMDETDGSYSIGPLASELSLASLNGHHSIGYWSALVPRVARATGHTSYLMVRSGREAVCVQRAEGHATIRMAPIDVGQRRPLGVGAGSTALLAVFPAEEIETFTKSLGPMLHPFKNVTPESVLEDALAAKRAGYAVSLGRVFDGVAGLGIALSGDKFGEFAVSITCPPSYLEETGVDRVVELIRGKIDAYIP